MLVEDLNKAVLPHLEPYEARISAAGIRYGSVAYIGFGDGVTTPHKTHVPTTSYPVEVEFGADYWEVSQGGNVLMDSSFTNVDAARAKIGSLLIGRRVQGLITIGNESRLELDEDITLRSRVAPEPASGFLYSFHAAGEPTWETVDGVSTGQ